MTAIKKIPLELYFALLYIAGMGLSNYIVFSRLHISYDSKEYVGAILPFLGALATASLICCIACKNRLIPSWEKRGRLTPFLMVFLPLIAMAGYYALRNASLAPAFLLPLAAALLVGIAEETMFRRILYVGLLRDFHGLGLKPVLISAAMFSLLHAVNIFAGSPPTKIFAQLVLTFIAGLFYALMYDYTRKIGLPILLHFLWDYVLLSGAAEQIPVFGILMGVLEATEIVVILVLLNRKRKEHPIRELA